MMGANSFGQLVTIAIQLFSAPIFLSAWTPEQYGQWLMLTAVPAYLALADFGVTQVSATTLTMLMASKDYKSANEVYASTAAFVFIASIAAIFIGFFTSCLLYVMKIVDWSTALVCILLSISSAMTLAVGLLDIKQKASDKFHQAIYFQNLARLVEWCGYVLAIILSGGYLLVALLGLVGRLTVAIAQAYSTHILEANLRFNKSNVSLSGIKSLVRPALSFMYFPIGNAVAFQGAILAIGSTLGAPAAATFSIVRTICRAVVQMTGIYSHALIPAITVAVGKKNFDVVVKIFDKSLKVSYVIALISLMLLLIVGQALFDRLSHGELSLPNNVFYVMALYAFISSLWHVPRVILIASNNHEDVAKYYLAVSMVSVAAAYMCASAADIFGASVAVIAAEVVMLFISLRLARKLLSGWR